MICVSAITKIESHRIDHRIDTNAKLLEWIRHLTEKAWVTGPHIYQFVRLGIQHLPQIEIDYSA